MPPVGTDTYTTLFSMFKTGLALAGVGITMLLETFVTLKIVDKALAAAKHASPPHGIGFLEPHLQCSVSHLSIYAWQVLSYLVSPLMLRLDGRAWSDRDSDKAVKRWDDASPIQSLPVAVYDGGRALAWGIPGKFFFAPCMWKMAWAGKTVYSAERVSMLEFRAINKIPVMRFSLGIPGSAVIKRSVVDGKESMAFCYKYLPIVDHLRRADDKTIVGKMMIGNVCILYFELKSRVKIE